MSRESARYNPHVMHAHSSALRRGRHSEPGRIYLLTTVTRARERIFADFVLARLAIAQMRQITARGYCHTLAFVLMPDHLHWLIQLSEHDLSRVVGGFKANSARRVNRQRNTPGLPVWQHGFHDRAVRRDEDLIALARYVVANPLRAGLAARPGDYPHWDAIWL
ncbi:MAG TPA: transposase [Rhodocyclaceae bacterium]|nr:transposase [Rhodocyclaceae bacterium]